MNAYEVVLNKLNELNIAYEMVKHPLAYTTQEADSYIVGIEGVRTKSMFLTNKKKTRVYLLVMDDSKRLDMEKFKEIVGESRIKMGSAQLLFEKLKLTPGVVSPFGLMNNEDHDVSIYFDRDIMDEKRMSFHPNQNDRTIFLATTDLLRFIELEGYTYQIVDL